MIPSEIQFAIAVVFILAGIVFLYRGRP